MKKIPILLFVIITFSCESLEPPVDNEPIDSINRPEMRIGKESITLTENKTETSGFANPFDGLDLHQPEKIAIVNIGQTSKKKNVLQWQEGGVYELFEIIQEEFNLVRGAEGNNIRFENLKSLERINEEWLWMISSDEGQGLIMISDDLEITTNYEIEVDSIFDADTIAVTEQNGVPYRDLGDTLFVSADTLQFNDTLWIQLEYLFTDTISHSVDTASIEVKESYTSVLINLNNGKFYEVPQNLSLDFAWHKISHPFQVDKLNNLVYFVSAASGNAICKLDLNDLTLEIIPLPYPIETQWCVVDGKVFFYSNYQYPKAFCYVPGQGLITKSNVGPEPDIGSIYFGKDRPLIWIRDQQGAIYGTDGLCRSIGIFSMFELDILNDSMIFTPVKMYADLTKQEIDGYFGSSIGDYLGTRFRIQNKTWHFNNTDRVAWSFDEESGNINVFDYREFDHEVLNRTINNGSPVVLSLFNNSVYKLDLTVPSLTEFKVISDMEIHDFSMGPNQSFFLSGMRFSDLADVVYEYSISSGGKIGEWSTENAPPATQIIQLTEIFN